jgi:hypothetical protein
MSSARHHCQAVRIWLTILAVMPGAGHVSPVEGIKSGHSNATTKIWQYFNG